MSKELYEQVREWVKDPQHGSKDYGQLGALPKHIRDTIHKLCDFAESADKVAMEKIKELDELKKRDTKILELLVKLLNTNMLGQEGLVLINQIKNILCGGDKND